MEIVFVKKLVDEWAKMGHRCVVVTEFPLMTYLHKRIAFKPRHYTDDVAPEAVVDVYTPRVLNIPLMFRDVEVGRWLASRSIKRQIKRLGIQFDFIYCHFFSSAIIAYQYAHNNNVPLFVATGESYIPMPSKPFRRFTFEAFRNYTSGVIAVSSKNKDEAAKLGLINQAKCRVFPNGTDLSVFLPLNKEKCRIRLGLPHDAFIISCVGFFCERKGQGRLLEAVRRLKDKNIKILFIGKEAILESVALVGDEILFKGSVENKEIPTYLCASDVFCLPTRAEGCCNALIEALACGLPVISSDLPFNWDVLDENNSIMVDPNNVEEIAEAIKTLQTKEALLESLSEGALKKSYSLSLNKRASEILKYIERIIDNDRTK
jgi:glycosyltransferase involved in cell wall biosynthesis